MKQICANLVHCTFNHHLKMKNAVTYSFSVTNLFKKINKYN